jgi:FkbM family methyltransferase
VMTRSTARDASRERIRKGRKVLQLLRRGPFRRALLKGVAAGIEHEDVAFEHSFRTVIDVGAHRGQFALFALQHYPDATLHCFEPLPGAYGRLSDVLPPNGRVHLHHVAASEASGSQPLHVSQRDDSSSLLPIMPRCTSAFPGTTERYQLTVRTARLDEELEGARLDRPCLLKIDVQGSELSVLRGAGRLLSSVDEVYVECSFVELYEGQPLASDVICYLRRHDLTFAGLFGMRRDERGRCIQADLLFKRSRDPK